MACVAQPSSAATRKAARVGAVARRRCWCCVRFSSRPRIVTTRKPSLVPARRWTASRSGIDTVSPGPSLPPLQPSLAEVSVSPSFVRLRLPGRAAPPAYQHLLVLAPGPPLPPFKRSLYLACLVLVLLVPSLLHRLALPSSVPFSSSFVAPPALLLFAASSRLPSRLLRTSCSSTHRPPPTLHLSRTPLSVHPPHLAG